MLHNIVIKPINKTIRSIVMTEIKNSHQATNPEFMNIYSPKNLSTKSQKQTNHSVQLKQKQKSPTQKSSLETQPNPNSFIALKRLRETEDQIRKIRGRFKVLKIKQDSFKAKTIHHQHILKQSQQTQKYRSQHKNDIMRASMERQKEISETKERNIKVRDQIRQRTREVRENMLQEKIQENRKIKQQSIENDKKFRQIKIEDKEEKIERRKRINQLQRQQKLKIDRYNESRINETKESKTFDMNQFVQKNSLKQKQLEELMKLEDELERQHMHSVQASRVLKLKLQTVINRRKATKNPSNSSETPNLSQDTKLPDINVKTSSVRVDVKATSK